MIKKVHITILLAFVLVGGMIVSPVSAWTPIAKHFHNDNPTVTTSLGWYQSCLAAHGAGNCGNGAEDCGGFGWCFGIIQTGSTANYTKAINTPLLITRTGGNNNTIYVSVVKHDAWTLLDYETFVWQSGSTVIAPVAQFVNVATPKTCYSPGEMVDFADLSTNTPTSWQWKIYDPLGIEVSQDEEHEQNPWLYLGNDVGWYDIHLTVENAAGIDEEEKLNYIEVAAGGTCLITNVTVQPTIALIPTGIQNIINVTKLRADADNTSIGNLSGPYLDGVDYFAEGVNSTFSEILGIFTLPLDWVKNAVEGVSSDIVTLATPLVSTSAIFLGIVSRALAALPIILVNIVTLGLLIDVVRIVLRGVGGD